MVAAESHGAHGSLMDRVYRHQRHIYDLTRKHYLLGRDRLIEGLDVPDGGSVLELGCGTGRNLAAIAKRYPKGRLFGLDISAAMLETAREKLSRTGSSDRIRLAIGDATDFDPQKLFAETGFDRVFFSYALSMIPNWQGAVRAGHAALNPGGELHIVDFGQQEGLPAPFKAILHRWLAAFHVEPREGLQDVLSRLANETSGRLAFQTPYRGYAVLAKLTNP